MRVESPFISSGVRRRSSGRTTVLALALGVGVVLVLATLVGLAYAGSPTELAEGTSVAGIDVGERTRSEAVAELSRRYGAVSAQPVTFVASGKSYAFAAEQLGVEPDWGRAVAAAARTSDGFGPLRGFRRLHTRFFGAEILPPVAVSNAALEYALDTIASDVDQAPRDAAVVRHGLRIDIVADRSGRALERRAAAVVVVRALASIERGGGAVTLPVRTQAPRVTEAMLERVARRARIAVSGPVFLRSETRSWRIPRSRIAELLSLPRDGATRVAIGGAAADAFFRVLAERVGRPPADAGFAVSGDSVGVVPAREGTELDVPTTARRLLRAATSPTSRSATLVVARAAPDRSTAEARAMGIDRQMGSYKTYYSGTADRISNLRLGVTYLDGTLVPPGGTFSLNSAIGERTVERGFRSAPVIIGTEFDEEVGGGTSQVATTVFNAAWESGLRITERNPHSLYISRYQLGRDATVYWPSLDLKFQNDTKRWVLVKGFPESDGIRVSIYGGERRRVVSSPGTMTVTGSAPVKRIKDPTLPKGSTVVDEEGSSPSRTSVERTIYGADGKLIRTETWNTSYKGETRVIRVGTKPKVKTPPAKPSPKGEATTDTTANPPPTQP